MALVGNMIHDAFGGNPSIVNYCMFVAVLSMLSLFYLVLVDFKDGLTFHPRLPFGLEVLNAFTFLIGGIALAAYLGVHSCGNFVSTRKSVASLNPFLTSFARTTLSRTWSPLARTTLPNGVTRPRRCALSCGSASQRTPYRLPRLCSETEQQCRDEVFDEVGHPCLKSR